MSRTTFDRETILALTYLKPAVEALNALLLVRDAAQDAVFKAEETGLDEGDVQEVRDWANDQFEDGFDRIRDIADRHNINLAFNRIGGEAQLRDRP